jgi:hypothetical protein
VEIKAHIYANANKAPLYFINLLDDEMRARCDHMRCSLSGVLGFNQKFSLATILAIGAKDRKGDQAGHG